MNKVSKIFVGFLLSILPTVAIGQTMIVKGDAPTDKMYNLNEYNRITFSHDRMLISSSYDTSVLDIELIYKLYNELSFNLNLSVEDVEYNSDSKYSLYYDSTTRSIRLITDESDELVGGVFNLNGLLLINGSLSAERPFNLSALAAGSYIAIATDGQHKLYVKFIITE